MLARGINGNGQFGRDFMVGEASRNQAQHDCLTCGEFQYGSPSTIERASPSLSRERRSPLNIHDNLTGDRTSLLMHATYQGGCAWKCVVISGSPITNRFFDYFRPRIVRPAVCRPFEFRAIVSLHHTLTARFLMMIDITD